MKDSKILNIKDIVGFEVLTNGTSSANIGGAIAGGLLFGGVGAIIGGQSKEKIPKMSFLFKTNDFHNPNIEIPIIVSSVKKGSFEDQAIQEKIKNLTSTLEIVERSNK